MKKFLLLCIFIVCLNAEWFYEGSPKVGSYILITNENKESQPVEVVSINKDSAICLDENNKKINVKILKSNKKTIVVESAHKPKKIIQNNPNYYTNRNKPDSKETDALNYNSKSLEEIADDVIKFNKKMDKYNNEKRKNRKH